MPYAACQRLPTIKSIVNAGSSSEYGPKRTQCVKKICCPNQTGDMALPNYGRRSMENICIGQKVCQ